MNDERIARETLGARLKEAREYLGFSQEEVAGYLGMPQTALSLMENGSRHVEALELGRLAELYQTTPEYLAGLERECPEPESIPLVEQAVAELSEIDRNEVLRFVRFLQSRPSNEQT